MLKTILLDIFVETNTILHLRLFKIEMFCSIMNVFTVTFD